MRGLGVSLFTNNYSPLPLSFLFGYKISSHIILIAALEIFDRNTFYMEIKKSTGRQSNKITHFLYTV